MRYIARAFAALAIFVLTVLGATQAQATPPYNDPWTLCGATNEMEDYRELPHAVVYLMYDPDTDLHCVVTIKDDPYDTQEVAAWIIDEYGYFEDRNYGPYAGPLYTDSHFFYWGGSHGYDSTGDIPHGHDK